MIDLRQQRAWTAQCLFSDGAHGAYAPCDDNTYRQALSYEMQVDVNCVAVGLGVT